MASSVRMLAAPGCRGGKATHGGGPEDDWLFRTCHPFQCTFYKHLNILSPLHIIEMKTLLMTSYIRHCTVFIKRAVQNSPLKYLQFSELTMSPMSRTNIVAMVTNGSNLSKGTWKKRTKTNWSVSHAGGDTRTQSGTDMRREPIVHRACARQSWKKSEQIYTVIS